MKIKIFTILLLGLFLVSLVFAEEIPFYQCIGVQGANVENIDCFFTQGVIYSGESMTASALDNQFCFNINNSSYADGTYIFSVFCNDTDSYNASVISSFIIKASPIGSPHVAPLIVERLSDKSFWDNITIPQYILGFAILVVIFAVASGRKNK